MQPGISRTGLALTAGLILCAISTSAQANPPAAHSPEKEQGQKSSIQGRVVNAVTNEPVRSVALTLIPAGATRMSDAITTESNENGEFIFQDLQPARYLLYGERSGYARQYYGSRSNWMSGTSLIIASVGQQIKDVVFKLAPSSVIAGRVFDDQGDPLANARVMALRTAYTSGKRDLIAVGSTQTNDLGEYRLAGLKAGSYVVSVTYQNVSRELASTGAKPAGDKPEMALTTTYFPNTTDAASPGAVEVGVGGEIRGIDIQMVKVPTFRVKGKVPEAQRGKVSTVMLTPRGVGLTSMVFTRPRTFVQSDGTFEFKGVPPGSYWLSAMGSDQNSESIPEAIEVGDKHIDYLAVQVISRADLPVSVGVEGNTSVDLKGAVIQLSRADIVGYVTRVAFEDGKYTAKGIAPGLYEVRVSNLPENVYTKSVRMGMTEVEGVLDLSGGVRGILHIILSANGAQVDGAVRAEDGNPMPGAVAALIPNSGKSSLYRETTTDQSGAFSFKGVPPGDYKLLAWEDIDAGAYQDPGFVKQFEGQAVSVSLKENDRKTLSCKAVPAERSKGGQ